MEPGFDIDISVKREPGGRVVTTWDLGREDHTVVCQAYVQPDGTLVYERCFEVIK